MCLSCVRVIVQGTGPLPTIHLKKIVSTFIKLQSVTKLGPRYPAIVHIESVLVHAAVVHNDAGMTKQGI